MEKKSNCRICRRLGLKLFLKGEKCNSGKCPFERRSYAPGHLGAKARIRRGSDYSVQLSEKQKLRAIYGVSEKQLSNYYVQARKDKTGSADILLQLLERRLDNVVFRAGWSLSRDHARQMITHGLVKVSDKKTKSPGYLVKAQEVLQVEIEKDRVQKIEQTPWLKIDKDLTKVTVISLPTKPEISDLVNEQFVIEYYSR
jgi:small subunit ribosomal protein S4